MALALLLSTGSALAVYGGWLPWALRVALVVGVVMVMIPARRSPGHLVAADSVAQRTKTWRQTGRGSA